MSPDPREHVLATALKLVGEQGIARTTVADVASAAGVSRATLYRYFPGGKDDLMQSMVEWEVGQFLFRLAERVGGAPDLVHLVSQAVAVGRRAVETHEQLQQVLATEPERLMPLMRNAERGMRAATVRYVLPVLRAEHPERDDHEWIADELARMFLTFIDSPGTWDLADPVQVDELVNRYFLAWRSPPPG